MAAAAAAAALPDDLLLDIFSLLTDPIDLLRCAATCGRWFRLILLLPDAATAAGKDSPLPRRSSFILGAFSQSLEPPFVRNNKPSYYCPPQFVRLHAPPLPRVSSSCIFPNSDGLFTSSYYAKPLASRRGLLLSRLTPTPLDQRKLHLAVSHPLLAARTRLLPPPPLDHLDLTCYALLPDGDANDPAFFRVLITAIVVVSDSGDRRHHHLVHRAYSYSSATGLWSTPVECPTSGLAMLSGPRAGTVDAHGTAHWLYRDRSSFYTLAVTGDATHAGLTKLPFIEVFQREHFHLRQPLFPCLDRDGDIALVHIRREAGGGPLEIWKKKVDHDGGIRWVRSEQAGLECWKALGFAESAGKLLVVHRRGAVWPIFSWLDVESGVDEAVECSHGRLEWYYPTQVCDAYGNCHGYDSCNECTYNCRVLYELHWPSFLRHISAWS